MSDKYAFNCQHCWKGIPFDTWYFICLFCDSNFCNECHSDHPSSHTKWFRHMKTRSVPRGANPESVECQKCMKMVHCRIQCMQCDVAFCGNCISDDTRGCWEDHGHKRLEFVPPPEWGIMEGFPCLTCPSNGSTGHCRRCTQGLENGEPLTYCLTCEKLYGAGTALCPTCLPIGRKEHNPAHEWASITLTYKPLAEADWFEAKCKECGQEIDVSVPSNMQKHAHHKFSFSYGRNIWNGLMANNWKSCNNKPPTDLDMANIELWSKSDAKCKLCGTGFPNLTKAYMCLTCIETYCPTCFERGPGRAHEHECTELYIRCEEPPDNLHQHPQEAYQQTCSLCRAHINIWRSQNLTCLSCKEWFVCPGCVGEKGSTIHHSCSKSATPTLLSDDIYPVNPQWWSEETVLARQVNPTEKPISFVIANKNFAKKDAEDMGVRIRDRLVVTGFPNYKEWYEGRNDWTGQTGIFPFGCVIEDEDAVQIAKQHGWLASEEDSSQSSSVSASSAPAAPEASPEAKMHHSDKKMEVAITALKFGAVFLGLASD